MKDLKYFAVPHVIIPLGFDASLVSIENSDKNILLDAQSLDVLAACKKSGTLESLIRQATEMANTFDDEATVSETVRNLIDKGLIRPTNETLSHQCRALPSQPVPISSAVFPTAGRLLEIERAVSSYADNFILFGRQVELLVVDDSRSEPEPGYLKRIEISARGLPMRYAGLREKEAYVEELARVGINPEVARFAILAEPADAITTGANRNAALLDTVGDCIFSADDDTSCDLTFHPDRNSRLSLSGHIDPREYWFYRNRQQLFRDIKWESCDLLREHQALLGRKLVEISSIIPPDAIDIDGACGHLLKGLERNDESRIVGTVSGVAGDSGSQTPFWILTAKGATRQKLAEDDDVFGTALISREILGVAPFCLFGDGDWFGQSGLTSPILPDGSKCGRGFCKFD